MGEACALAARGARVAVRFNPVLFDELIAPNASKFTRADVPDMQDKYPDRRFWLTNLFLNSVGRGRYKWEFGAYVTAFLRRAEGSFVSHGLAREATTALLAQPQTTPSHYARALLHWEGFVGQSAMAQSILLQIIRGLCEDPAYKLFERGDASVEQRIWSLNNSMKHVESRIAAGQILPGSVSPVWLSNEGLQSTDTLLAWAETGEVLDDIARWADGMQDPISFNDWLRTDKPK